jgi:hypothetical protein
LQSNISLSHDEANTAAGTEMLLGIDAKGNRWRALRIGYPASPGDCASLRLATAQRGAKMTVFA